MGLDRDLVNPNDPGLDPLDVRFPGLLSVDCWSRNALKVPDLLRGYAGGYALARPSTDRTAPSESDERSVADERELMWLGLAPG